MPEDTLTLISPERKLKPGDILLVKDTGNTEASALVIDTQLTEIWGEARPKSKYKIGVLAAEICHQIFERLEKVDKAERHSRYIENIAAAKARGVKLGRKAKVRPDTFNDVCTLWKQGEISAREAGKRLGVSHVTFLTWAGDSGSG